MKYESAKIIKDIKICFLFKNLKILKITFHHGDEKKDTK